MKKLVFMALAVTIVMASCTPTRVVTLETVKTDTAYIVKLKRDSIHVHDSIRISEKGDTVKIDHWHTEWRDREVHDTLYISKTDSIPYPVEVTKEVKKPLTWWQKTQMYAGDLLMLLVVIGIGIAIIRKKLPI